MDDWAMAGVTRVEVRLEPVGAAVTSVAYRLRRALARTTDIAQPVVGIAGAHLLTVSFTVGDDTALGPAVHDAVGEIRRALVDSGLESVTLEVSGIAVLERSPAHSRGWSREEVLHHEADREELESLRRWPEASALRATLVGMVEEARRRADAHRRLDGALRHLR